MKVFSWMQVQSSSIYFSTILPVPQVSTFTFTIHSFLFRFGWIFQKRLSKFGIFQLSCVGYANISRVLEPFLGHFWNDQGMHYVCTMTSHIFSGTRACTVSSWDTSWFSPSSHTIFEKTCWTFKSFLSTLSHRALLHTCICVVRVSING